MGTGGSVPGSVQLVFARQDVKEHGESDDVGRRSDAAIVGADIGARCSSPTVKGGADKSTSGEKKDNLVQTHGFDHLCLSLHALVHARVRRP